MKDKGNNNHDEENINDDFMENHVHQNESTVAILSLPPNNDQSVDDDVDNILGGSNLPTIQLKGKSTFNNSDLSKSLNHPMKSEKGKNTMQFTNPDSDEKENQNMHFNKAFRYATYLYAERKMMVMILIHFMCTIIVWSHFAVIKYQEKENTVPPDANRYWWKRIAPPLEFGSTHAVLFQFSLIPLTMSRLTISFLSNSVLNKIIPFNRMLRFHINLGYTMVFFVYFGTFLSFTYIGLLCSDGNKDYCLKFTSEIMISGYVILGLLSVITISSYVRYKIPYGLFYKLHHLVFIMYALAIAHTFDNVQRSGDRNRSQTFKWCSAALLYYICDRAYMSINHRHQTPISFASAIASGLKDGEANKKMAILKLRRPTLFQFKPGQYAFLRISQIDDEWHPFSIASGPDSEFLEFYIEVYDDQSWTGKLFHLIDADDHSFSCGEGKQRTNKKIVVEVQGPYGTSLGKIDDYSHTIAIGSGTGIVPMMSLLKQHARQMLRLDPSTYFRENKKHRRKMKRISDNEDAKYGQSFFNLIFTKALSHQYCLHLSPSFSIISSFFGLSTGKKNGCSSSISDSSQLSPARKKEYDSFSVRLAVYISVAIALIVPVWGVALIGFAISWSTIPIEHYSFMCGISQVGSILFLIVFFIITFTIQDCTRFMTFIDCVITFLGGICGCYWSFKRQWVNFDGGHIIFYVLIFGYMTLRSWYTAVKPQTKSLRRMVNNGERRVVSLDKLQFVWASRSAALVSEIIPDIIDIWDAICKTWGKENAKAMLDISIYITDKDEAACEALRAEIEHTSLYQSSAFHFKRPDFNSIIRSHNHERMMEEEAIPQSDTLLAFCGSIALSSKLHEVKMMNDLSMLSMGNRRRHRMEFASESYGASSSSSTDKKKAKTVPKSEMRPTTAPSLNRKCYSGDAISVNSCQTPPHHKHSVLSPNSDIESSAHARSTRKSFIFDLSLVQENDGAGIDVCLSRHDGTSVDCVSRGGGFSRKGSLASASAANFI